MKPMAAERPAKSARPASKVFDISHPGKGTPSATARPVIISNRPLLQDPMVSPPIDAEPATTKTAPASVKITIEPPHDSDDSSALDSSEEADKTGKVESAVKTDSSRTIAELAAQAAADKPSHADGHESDEAETSESTTTTESDPKHDAAESAESDEPLTEPSDESADSAATSDNEDLLAEDSKDSKETATLEAAAKLQEGIDTLVDSRKYELPINSVEKHRSKVVAVFGLVLILTLGLALLDLLLDVGFVRLQGVHALTHFFSV